MIEVNNAEIFEVWSTLNHYFNCRTLGDPKKVSGTSQAASPSAAITPPWVRSGRTMSTSSDSSSPPQSADKENQVEKENLGSGNYRKRRIDPVTTQLSTIGNSLSTFLSERMKRNTEREARKTEKESRKDVNDRFAVTVAEELKLMPEDVQKEKRAKIMALLYEKY